MKNILTAITMMFTTAAFAQVAIGKAEVSSGSVSLEFGDSEARGIILPYVTGEADVATTEGSLIFDSSDNKVKYYNGSWVDLTVLTNGTANLAPQTDLAELPDAKATVGTPSTTPGILVLEDTNKAMVLPKVADPHLNIQEPAPGMMVYDTNKKLLCLFNGTEWTFWQAGE